MSGRWPNVVLAGFMGTGKTTVGRALASKLCYQYVDTDAVIVERHGPIADIFANEGEDAFRRYEHQVAVDLAQCDGQVIATGGGLVLRADNVEPLAASGYVFCLTASVDTIMHRVTKIADPSTRPLLAGDDPRGRVTEMLAEREDAYSRFAQVDTDGKSPGEIADEIVSMLAPNGGEPSRCGCGDC